MPPSPKFFTPLLLLGFVLLLLSPRTVSAQVTTPMGISKDPNGGGFDSRPPIIKPTVVKPTVVKPAVVKPPVAAPPVKPVVKPAPKSTVQPVVPSTVKPVRKPHTARRGKPHRYSSPRAGSAPMGRRSVPQGGDFDTKPDTAVVKPKPNSTTAQPSGLTPAPTLPGGLGMTLPVKPVPPVKPPVPSVKPVPPVKP